MRFSLKLAALAAASLLSSCVFESAGPLVPPAEYSTPLATGTYSLLQLEESGIWIKDSDTTLTVSNSIYTATNSDGPMSFSLYRLSPNIFLAQASDKPDAAAYALLEPTATGADITHLPCKSLSPEERVRFHLAQSSESSCVFTSLDDLVTAALFLRGRGEAPSIRLEKH